MTSIDTSITDNVRTKIILIENETKHIEDIIANYSEQINKLREDTAMQAVQIDNLEKDIAKLEEIVDTYRGKIDANCDFIDKHDEKYGCKITDIQHEMAVLKTTIALNSTTSSGAILYPSESTLPSQQHNQSSHQQTQHDTTTITTTDLSTAGKIGRKSIDSITDTLIKIGAIIISLASFVVGWVKV